MGRSYEETVSVLTRGLKNAESLTRAETMITLGKFGHKYFIIDDSIVTISNLYFISWNKSGTKPVKFVCPFPIAICATWYAGPLARMQFQFQLFAVKTFNSELQTLRTLAELKLPNIHSFFTINIFFKQPLLIII